MAMLQLTVVAPNKQKAEFECAPTATFGDVKARVHDILGVPPDKQRLLCSGKERKDNKETLAAAKVGAKCKLMLMLAPGYTMPAAPAQAPTGAASEGPGAGAPAAGAEAPAPVEANGELPLPAGVAASDSPGVVHVRQAKNRYHVTVPQGLAAATFGELADYLPAAFFAQRGVTPAELRFLVRGKTAQRSDMLGAAGSREVSVMLLFQETFHLAEEGAAWLRERLVELADLEEQIGRLAKRIEANFAAEETSMQLAEVRGAVETMEQSVDSVQVRESAVPEMQGFRKRVLAAKEQLDKLRKGVTL
eukprot:TRINITY_DN46589_c0_g1_i1.p1 TRINITY_DN46589_c0_g1~~TRINITY_DN46589_c0_g1_i1.p1  ORF type:complete len:320 (+),score=73.21 TRINITY_DN46589_c0_g1_i1:46-960(+)